MRSHSNSRKSRPDLNQDWGRDPAKFGPLAKAYFRWRFGDLPNDFDPIANANRFLRFARVFLPTICIGLLTNIWLARVGYPTELLRFLMQDFISLIGAS